MTYLALNSWFIVPIWVAYFARFRMTRFCRDRYAILVLLLLTAVFDNFIVGLGIVGYDETKLSGIKVLFAPIEDFGYALVVVPLVALLTAKLDKDKP